MPFVGRNLETLIGDLAYRRLTLFMGARMGNFGMKISRATASSLRAASNARHNCFPNVSTVGMKSSGYKSRFDDAWRPHRPCSSHGGARLAGFHAFGANDL
jgi:hypothetical protein